MKTSFSAQPGRAHAFGQTLSGARLVLVVLAALWLAGCSSLVSQAPAMAHYDLGPGGLETRHDAPAAARRQGGLSLARVEVMAPPWLESSAMQYRLEASDPARRRAYALSRWVAPPPALLDQVLTRSLGSSGAVGVGGAGCRLRVELDEFIQRFDAAGQSYAELLVRAQLLPERAGGTLAARAFDISVAAPSADAPGGVHAHRAASQELARALADWLRALDTDQRVHDACAALASRTN